MKGGIGSEESELGPTEDTISALLELLVDPLLPSASSLSRDEAPSSAQEESVAKQVQAVVLLYDYYHRKCNPELGFLDHVSFSKLAVVLKPSLLPYMKFVRNGKDTKLDDPDRQLSVTDKKIIEACDMSKSLETSKADVAGLPIAKAAVFLVDSSRECCFLLHSSITQGVWSVIEKEPGPNLCLEGSAEEKVGSRKKRITKKPLKDFRNDETGFQQLAFAAVKEICGCSRNDLKILESHTVYSISKAKTAVRFYIMQCKQTKEEDNFVPIRDVLDSLQGPLVTKESCGWSTSSLVEYFHLLPYADIISDWFSGQPTLEASHEAELEQENSMQPSSDSKGEDNESEQSQKAASISNEVTEPCKLSHKEDLEAGISTTVTKTNTALKVDTEQEIARVMPVTTLENNDRKLEVDNQSKEAPSRVLRSGVKLEKMKGADKKVETVETVVYTKRKKSVKKDKVGDSSGCKPSKVDAECSIVRKDSEISMSGLSNNNMEIDEPVSSVDCSTDGKNKSCSDEEHVADEMTAIVLYPTTDVVTKEEIVSSLQNNHDQNGENNNGKVKAVSSRQDKAQEEIISTPQNNHEQNGENNNARVKFASSCQDGMQDEIISTLQNNHEQNGENNNARVKVISSCQDGMQDEIISTLQSNHEKKGENHNTRVKFVSSRQHGLQEEMVSTLQNNHEQNGENNNAKVKAVSACQDGVQANALVPFHSNPRELDRIHKVVSVRENSLSQAALKFLHRKRDMLSYQLRSIGDELALCNRNIQAILNGSEDDLGAKLDLIIEGCNFENFSSGVSDHERIYQCSQDQSTCKSLKRKRLCEANLSVLNPCQELDDICHENCWMLPTYNISPTSDGGFQASVTVKGVDFECPNTGSACNTPREARESAASSALTKLRNMAQAL